MRSLKICYRKIMCVVEDYTIIKSLMKPIYEIIMSTDSGPQLEPFRDLKISKI